MRHRRALAMIRIFGHYMHRRTLTSLLSDFGLLLVAVLGAFLFQGGSLYRMAPSAGTHVLSLAASLLVVGTASGIYQNGSSVSLVQRCARGAVMLLFLLPLTYAIFALMPADMAQRQVIRVAAMFGIAVVVLRRVFMVRWGTPSKTRSKVLVFGCGAPAQIVGETLRAADPGVEIVGYFPGPNETGAAVPASEILSRDKPLTNMAKALDVDEIVVALTERRAGSMPLRELLDCKLGGVKVYDLATHFEKRLGQIRVDFVNAGWLVFGDGFNQGAWRTFFKRVFDIAFGSLLLVITAPIMLVTALLIKLDSRGPIFYRQERVGANHTTFMVSKFRSMRTDAEKDGKPRWATTQDDRVTRVGNIIRKLRIDELPQLLNVFKGEMSLVGPRPERPYFVEQLTREIPYFAVRHSVKPGVTGWAQVRYQYGATVEDSQEKLQYDLYYVKNHSLFLDLVVLFETVGVVLTGKGAR
jgi:sugar transferase (PEP-CTERM system associated)